ncbi:site-specific integrase [Sphingomonas sp. AX6]|uniref:site-specific integrase n=1 Tax=Sphingomonas sp. AX6 TaxID=2653171 RepID=UPI001359AB27|nr:site-specific integrase [Sphingomonas sp. AX6]
MYLDKDILDRWATERGVVPKGKDTHRSVAEWFYARTERKPVERITRQDVLAFKDKLLAEGQSVANTNMKLSRLRTLLGWAYQNDLAPANVAEGISVKVADSGKGKRLPFALDELQAIFASPVYANGDRPKGGKGEAAYWLPLLGLFTGARLEEIGQLRVSDVQRRNYPDKDGKMLAGWFLHITESTDERGQANRIKNAASERLVPLHPELERLGFIAYVEALKDQQGRVFPDLVPNIYGRLTAKWGEWFGPYMRKVCGITDKRKVFHSFRHTFKDYSRRARMPEGVQRQIMGHAGKDVADDYGSGYDLHGLAEAMATYRVPGLLVGKV